MRGVDAELPLAAKSTSEHRAPVNDKIMFNLKIASLDVLMNE